MPGAYTLEWRDGRKVDIFGHRGYFYVFPDGQILSFLPTPAWCNSCKDVRLCEERREAASIEAELAELEDPESDRSMQIEKGFSAGFANVWKEELQFQLRHARVRNSRPSCLQCGQRSVTYFEEGVWAPHPETGEEVRFSCSGMCSTDFAMRFYDIDGNPLIVSDQEEAALRDKVIKDRLF